MDVFRHQRRRILDNIKLIDDEERLPDGKTNWKSG